jgi:cell wall-associated NlpC family hydrolase
VIASWAREYVGIPFADLGRTRADGLDCWGLVRLVLRERTGVELPSLTCEYASTRDERVLSAVVLRQRPLVNAESVDEPAIGDIVLLRLRGLLSHVGVYVGGGCMLHTRRRTGAVVEDLRSPLWARRVEGYYRA